MPLARRSLASAALALFASAAALATDVPADWLEPVAPFRVAGNLYYVGSRALASWLVATPDGLVLINSNLAADLPQLKARIETLGFKFEDIKVLLINHAHFDHDAGSAALIKATGAKYMVMDGDAPVVESGGKLDFQYPNDTYPIAKVDRVLHDGDTVALGGTTLVAHKTAGHTRGNTTWTLKVEDGGRTLDAVIVGSPYVNPGYRLVANDKYPRIADDYAHGFEVLKRLPCDLFLGAHGSYFDMDDKLARAGKGPNPFIDPAGYRAFVAETEQKFREKLAAQQAEARKEK